MTAQGKFYALIFLYCVPQKIGRRIICWNPHEERLEEMVASGGCKLTLRGMELEEDSVPVDITILPPPPQFTLDPSDECKYYRSNSGSCVLFFRGARAAVFHSSDGQHFQQLNVSHHMTTVHEDYLEFRAVLRNIWRSKDVAIANIEPQRILTAQRDHFKLLADAMEEGNPVFHHYLPPSSILVTTTTDTR